MKKKKMWKRGVGAVLMMVIFVVGATALQATPKKAEAALIQMLHSGDYHTINDALDRLPDWYPNSTNALQIIRGMLRSNEVLVVTKPSYRPESAKGHVGGGIRHKPVSHTDVVRIIARSRGKYHATPNEDELNIVCKLMSSRDEEIVMDGLKALRGMNAPQAVPKILPLLEDKNHHVVRDACRTLAVLGDASIIPSLVPLLTNPRSDIKWDAQNAIAKLKSKH